METMQKYTHNKSILGSVLGYILVSLHPRKDMLKGIEKL